MPVIKRSQQILIGTVSKAHDSSPTLDNCPSSARTSVLRHLVQHVGRHVLVRQLLDDLLRSLRHVTGAGEDEGERPQRARHHAKRDLVAGVPHRLPRHLRIAIVVRRANVLKPVKMALLPGRQQSMTKYENIMIS